MNYHPEFDKFWTLFASTSPSPKGSKYEAYNIWHEMKEKKLLPPTMELLQGVIKHASNDKFFKAKKEFVPSWKHGCRWLSQRCWEVEDEAQIARDKAVYARQQEIKKKEQERQELQQKRQEASQAKVDWDKIDNPLAQAMRRKK